MHKKVTYDTPKKYHKMIIAPKHNLSLNKVKSIIKSKEHEIVILESYKSPLNTRTTSIACKLIIDDAWAGIENKKIKRKRDEKLLKITLIHNNKPIDESSVKHKDAETTTTTKGDVLHQSSRISSLLTDFDAKTPEPES